MIAKLTGKLETLSLDRIIVDVGGVGYLVRVPVGTTGRLDPGPDQQISIHVHTNVRDDAIDLYGFASAQEKELFSRLTSISGIGPKLALAVLSEMSPAEVIQGVRTSSIDGFTEVSGIGKKTAQRLILEMKSKVDDFEFQEIAPGDDVAAAGGMAADLRSALENLGFDGGEIAQVIKVMGDDLEAADELEPLIREALQMLKS